MVFSIISFSGEKTEYITPTWEDLNALTFRIAQKIIKDKQRFDRIVTLAKGGWPMTRSMVDFLQVEQVASIGIKFYSGINQRMKEPHIYQELPEKIRGENILLFDDVADTGNSLKFTLKHLTDNGAKSVVTATLFYKPHSVVKPDYYASQTSAWIIFPYEKIEAMKLLVNKWRSRNIAKNEIHSRLLKLGISEEYRLPA